MKKMNAKRYTNEKQMEPAKGRQIAWSVKDKAFPEWIYDFYFGENNKSAFCENSETRKKRKQSAKQYKKVFKKKCKGSLVFDF